MIESIMFFGGGFLVASLLALVAISLVHHRAVRLTERRLEDAIPVSMAEIQADKDNLRAEFAMSARRLEMSVEQLKAKATTQLGEIARKTQAINRLKAELAERTAITDELEATAKGLAAKIRETEQEYDAKTASLEATARALAAKEEEFAKAFADINEQRLAGDTQRVEIAVLKAQVEQFKSQADELQHEVEDAARRLFEERVAVSMVTKEVDEKRQAVDVLRPQMAQLEREIATRTNELENRARRIDELAARNAEQEELLRRRGLEINALEIKLAANKDEHAAIVARVAGEKGALEVLLAATNQTVGSHAGRIGELAARNAELEKLVRERTGEISSLNQQLAADKDEHAAIVARVEGEKGALEVLLATTDQTVESHAGRIDELAARNAELEELVRERTGEISSLNQQLAADKDEHNAIVRRLEAEQSALEVLLATANQTVESHASRIEDLAARNDEHQRHIARRDEDISALNQDIADRQSRHDALTERHHAATATVQSQAVRIEALEALVAERDRLLSRRDAEAEALLDQIAAIKAEHEEEVVRWEADKQSLTRLLQTANHTLQTRASRIEDLEGWVAERDELMREREAEIRALHQEVVTLKDENAVLSERLRTENSQLETQLRLATESRSHATAEVSALKHEAEATWKAERVENALLRERINDIAAQVAHMVMTMDKAGPIEAILAESASLHPEAHGGAPHTDAESAAEGNLTDRIRKLRSGASQASPVA
jgi:chromosome segregation ATPase